MKKSTILSALTAAAIVASTAGTYALWDDLDQNTSKTFSVNVQSTNVETFQLADFSAVEGASDVVYTSTFNIGVTGSAAKMNLTPTLTDTAQGAPAIDPSYYEITIKDGDTAIAPTDGKYTDTTVTTSNPYTIEIKVKDKSLNGKTLQVDLAAVAEKQ